MNQFDKSTDTRQLSQLMDGEWHGLNPADCVAAVCADDTLQAKWARYHIIRDVMNNEPVEASLALTLRICAAIDDEPAYSNITPFSGTTSSGSTHDASMYVAQDNSAPLDSTQLADSTQNIGQPLQHGAINTGDTQDAVSEEHTRKQSSNQSSWFGSAVGGFALAASVALVTVVGMNLYDQQISSDVSSIASVDIVAPGAEVGNAAFVQDDTAVSLPVVEFVANTSAYWVSPESSERVIDEERLNMMLSRHIENSPTSSRSGLLPYSGLVGYEENGLER